MKLTVFLLLVSMTGAFANKSYSQTKMLNLDMREATVREVLNSIEEQSEFYFLYSENLIDVERKVNIAIENNKIEKVLNLLFEDTNVDYSIRDRIIVLTTSDVLTGGLQVLQQQKSASGTVIDESGQPLPGVTVLIKGTINGMVTNTDGYYSLANIPEDATLVFSFMGMVPQEITVGSKIQIDVTMKNDAIGIEEVVAIGYGTMKKSDVTGSISSINAEKIDKSTIKSVDQMLQGKSSGVYMAQNSGMPGAASTVRIRGGNSISGGNEPLYVIDGIPIYPGATSSQTGLSPLNSIATSDIESIEILKDASSTAIYGARGANGVILITTKRGKSGKTNITFESYIGIQSPSKTNDLLNAIEYEKYVNEAEVNGGGVAIYDENVTPVNTDWQDLCLIDNALMRNYTLSLSGGDDKTRFLTTFNLIDQEGIIKATDLTKMTLRVNLDKEISNAFKYTLNLSMAQVNSNRVGNSVLAAMVTLPPNIPLYNEDGTYRDVNMIGDAFINPLAQIEYNTNWAKQFRTLCNTGLEWNIVKGLTLKSTLGADLNFGDNQYYTAIIAGAESASGNAYVSATKSYMWLNENTLTFDKTIGDHHINVLSGLMQQTSKNQSVTARSQGFLNDNVAMYDLGSGVNNLPSSSNTYEWSLLSYLGRVNYGFSGKYLTTLSIRADGSSRFGKNNRWGYFPSAALAWRASEEEFIKSLNLFSNLKLRVSYGWTGNQDGIGIYPSMALLGKMTYGLGDTKFLGYGPTQVANYDLKWETTRQTDIGIEMGFFNNRLNITADAYHKTTSDLLLKVVIPSTSGYTSGLKNIGEVENKGIELGANVLWLDNKFRWETDINITFNKNKVVSLGEVNSLVPSTPGAGGAGLDISRLLKVGEPLGIFYGYRSNGVFSTTDDIASSAQPTAKLGDVRFRDISGPDGVPDNAISEYDREVIGCAQPIFFGGITNTFSYKNFNLMINMVGTYGNDIYNGTKAELESLNGWNNQSSSILNRWTPTNQNTSIPRAVNVKLTSRSWDHLVENGSYLRIQNIKFGYRLPEKIVSQTRCLRSVTLYLSLQNYFTFTKYSGLDPEVSKYGSDNLGLGYDYFSYPMSKSVLFGITVNF